MRIDVTTKMNTSDLVYKHPETKLEKNMELYSNDEIAAVVYQNGKFVNYAIFRGTKKLSKKNFKGLKASLFKKDINAEIYFVRPDINVIFHSDNDYDVEGKAAHFVGDLKAALSVNNMQKYVEFIRRFSGSNTGVLFAKPEFGGFLIGTMVNDLILKEGMRPFNAERTHESYMGNLKFKVYLKEEKIDRYYSIGLKARSIEVKPIELRF